MSLIRLQAILLLGIAPGAAGEELKPGRWVLETYRPDAPLNTVYLTVKKADDGFTFADTNGEATHFETVRVVDHGIEFEHPDFGHMCRLLKRPETAEWKGTCPPGNELQFDSGLTITLRPKKKELAAPEPDSADAIRGDSKTGDEPQ